MCSQCPHVPVCEDSETIAQTDAYGLFLQKQRVDVHVIIIGGEGASPRVRLGLALLVLKGRCWTGRERQSFNV